MRISHRLPSAAAAVCALALLLFASRPVVQAQQTASQTPIDQQTPGALRTMNRKYRTKS